MRNAVAELDENIVSDDQLLAAPGIAKSRLALLEHVAEAAVGLIAKDRLINDYMPDEWLDAYANFTGTVAALDAAKEG